MVTEIPEEPFASALTSSSFEVLASTGRTDNPLQLTLASMNPAHGRTDDPIAPIACDLSAIPSEQRPTHIALVRALFGDFHRVRELPDGLEASIGPDRLADAVSFIENERRCCRHLAFTLVVPPARAPLVLRVTGPGAADELRALLR
jgi:hypothetical protein